MTTRDIAGHLRELRARAQAQIEAWSTAGNDVPPDALRAGLRPFVMRWTLEEQLLFPALLDAFGGNREPFEHEERELVVLRGLVEDVQQAPADQQETLLSVLAGIGELHAESVDRIIERTREAGLAVDWSALSRSVAGMAERWQHEIEETGDIEDEDADPVGLPPR